MVRVPETVARSSPPTAGVTTAPALSVRLSAVNSFGSRAAPSAVTLPTTTSSWLDRPAPFLRSTRSNRYWPQYSAAPETAAAPASRARPEPSRLTTRKEPSETPAALLRAIQAPTHGVLKAAGPVTQASPP